MITPRQRLYLIDGYSTIFRAFYAIRDLSTSKGEPTNAVYGFVTMLHKLLREANPELVGVALDVSRRTVRSERFADYKANRAPMPPDLRLQIPWIRRLLEAYRIPILELESYEADDVLGTLARRAAEAGYEVFLVSADKDLMQLVAPGVSLVHTGREKLYSPPEVEADFGVPPEKVVDVLALMGDSVDNVPGVPGIGEKGAKKLVREFGSLQALLERVDDVERRNYREGLRQHREDALLSKELVTIHTDLPIPFEPDRLRLESPDAAALRELFSELEFFSLLEKLEAEAPVRQLPPAQAVADTARLELEGRRGTIYVAVVGGDEAAGLAVSFRDGEPFWLDFLAPGVRAAATALLQGWLADAERELVGHDLKEVLRLRVSDGAPRARLFDLMLASYLLKPSLKAHSLEELALEGLHYRAMSAKEAGFGKGQAPPAGDPRLAAFAGERVGLLRRLEKRLRADLAAEERLEWIYFNIEAPLTPVLAQMEEAGVCLDVGYLRDMSEELSGELEQLEAEIHRLAGERFNVNSPHQLGVVLFEKLGYPVLKRTRKTRSYSTDAETLEELSARGYPLPERLLRYREHTKLKSTYVDALPALVGADGRLHTRYQQAVAATGRLSSVNPNLQNIPVRTELGQRIRRAFVAPPGRCLLVADYSQIELRVLAHIARDEAMMAAFHRGLDIHQATAASVFGVPPGLVSPEQRRAAKTINFGIIYGMSRYGLSRRLGISPKEAQAFIDAYLSQYSGVRRYTEETLQTAEAEGKVETLYGRVRWLPELKSRNRNLRDNAQRMAINARIQGTAADLLKLAMIAVARRLEDGFPGSQLLLTVHDELVLEVPSEAVEEAAEAVRLEMEGVAELVVPLVVETGWGQSWYDAKRTGPEIR